MGTFINAVKNLINSLTAKTSSTASTADMVQLHDANGNPNGKISLADLASVLGGIETGYKTAVAWAEEIDSYHGNALYLCATSSSADDPFKSASFLLRIITAYTGNSPRTLQEAICVYGSNTGTRRYRVYSNEGWSQWLTVGTV